MQSAAPGELEHYLSADELDWDLESRQLALERITRSGHKTDGIDLELAFKHVRWRTYQPGELVIQANDPSGFVYIPLAEGLRVQPLGGYSSAPARAWIPLGVTGVIRGAQRNAQVTAEGKVEVLIIPKETYLRHWHATYSVPELVGLFERRQQVSLAAAATLNRLEKTLILQRVPLFARMAEEALAVLTDLVMEIRLAADQPVFQKGEPGDAMYVIVTGQAAVHDAGERINTLTAGEVFGEMALLDSQERNADVTALSELHLLRLERADFNRLMAARIEVAHGVIQVLLDRLRQTDREVIRQGTSLR